MRTFSKFSFMLKQATEESKRTTLHFKTLEAALLFELELKGQISDGKWENVCKYPLDWMFWNLARKLIIDGTAGYANEYSYPTKNNFDFTSKDLIECVGDRMLNIINNVDKARKYVVNNTLDLKRMRNECDIAKEFEDDAPTNPKYTMRDLRRFLQECKDVIRNRLA